MAAKKTTKVAETVVPAVEKEVKVTTSEAVKAEPAKTEASEESVAKTTAKKTTTRKTAVKETKKTAVKKETAKKDAVKKEEAEKKSAMPAAAKKAAVFVEFDGRQVSQDELIARIVEKWCAEEDKKASAIKELNVYIKPEDNAAYYVINGQGSSIEL